MAEDRGSADLADDLPPRGPDRHVEVEVDGAAIVVGVWDADDGGDLGVLASHGITANHRSFDAVATALAHRGVGVAAVDHRGRGGSSGHPGPFGLVTHADDLVAVADHLDVSTAVLVGHSMGGWIVANAGARHPDRWQGLVLVDGGVPTPPQPLPEGVTVDDALHATIGPAMARLDRPFASREAALDLWRAHPAVGLVFESARSYLEWDLAEADGSWASRVAREAVLADGGDILTNGDATTALARAPMPATLLRAPRDLLDQPPGFLDEGDVAAALDPLGMVADVVVEDVNHYSIVFVPHGVAAVVAAVEDHLG